MYEVIETPMGQEVIVKTNDDGTTSSFLADPGNTDYQTYLAFLAEQETAE